MGVPRQCDALPLWLGGSDGGAGSGGMACLEAVSAEGMYTSARIFLMTSAEKFLLFVFSAFHFIHMLFARSQLARDLNQEDTKDSKKCTILQSIFSFAVIRKCWEIGRQFREKVWLFAKNSSRTKYNVYVFLLTFERANVTIKLIFSLLKRYANFGKCCSCLIYCGKQKKVGTAFSKISISFQQRKNMLILENTVLAWFIAENRRK